MRMIANRPARAFILSPSYAHLSTIFGQRFAASGYTPTKIFHGGRVASNVHVVIRPIPLVKQLCGGPCKIGSRN